MICWTICGLKTIPPPLFCPPLPGLGRYRYHRHRRGCCRLGTSTDAPVRLEHHENRRAGGTLTSGAGEPALLPSLSPASPCSAFLASSSISFSLCSMVSLTYSLTLFRVSSSALSCSRSAIRLSHSAHVNSCSSRCVWMHSSQYLVLQQGVTTASRSNLEQSGQARDVSVGADWYTSDCVRGLVRTRFLRTTPDRHEPPRRYHQL